MQMLYFAIQLLQVLCLGYGALTRTKYNQLYPEQSVSSFADTESMRLKRQTSRMWTAGIFSECSVSCGGGLRTRSVRCLNEDGVISNDCVLNDRPASYEFCNQIDCATSTSNSALLPASGNYNFTSGEYSSVLQFNNHGSESYTLQLDTIESDGTGTRLEQTVTPQNTMTQLSTLASMTVTNIISSGGSYFLEVDGENILDLNNTERTDVASNESISDVIFGSGDTLNAFMYFDGFRYYTFTSNTVNPLNGPGILYYNPDTLQALFSIDASLNEALNLVTQPIVNDVTEVTTPLFPTGSTPDDTTTSVSVGTQPTTLPPGTPSTTLAPTTTALPSTTEDPTVVCDDDSSSSRYGSSTSPYTRRSPHSKRNPHTRRSPHSKSSSSSSRRSYSCDEDSKSQMRIRRKSKSHTHRRHGRQAGGPGGRQGSGPGVGPGSRAGGGRGGHRGPGVPGGHQGGGLGSHLGGGPGGHPGRGQGGASGRRGSHRGGHHGGDPRH